MREIKYRAWDNKRNIMIGTSYPEENWSTNEDEEYYCDDAFLFLSGIEKLNKNNRFNLMQYIEVKDKNNIEIYEGDIIYNEKSGFVGLVIFEFGCYLAKQGDIKMAFKTNRSLNCKVIGNIYENKGLLKENNFNV